MKIDCLLVLIVMLGSSVIHAAPTDDYGKIVSQALLAFDSDYKSAWAYKRTSSKVDEPAKIGFFDPRQPEANKWTLASIGDRLPTAEEQKAWALRRIQADKDNKDGMGNIVTPGSVQLLEESPTQWLFSFVPAPDADDDKKTRKLLSQVTGNLRVNKMGHYVEEIFLSNDKPIKPAMGVKINSFEMRMTYEQLADGGAVVPMGFDTKIQGRAFMAVSIDEIKMVRFSDYEKVISTGHENQSELTD